MLVIILEILCRSLKKPPLSILIFPAILFSMGDLTLVLHMLGRGYATELYPSFQF